VRAGLPPDELNSFFVDKGDGAARCERVLLLLGIITGTPTISLDLLEQMRTAKDAETLGDFASNVQMAAWWAPDSAEAQESVSASSALKSFAIRRGTGVVMSDFRPDIERISRYSFRLGRW
jgi:hypothetical protein